MCDDECDCAEEVERQERARQLLEQQRREKAAADGCAAPYSVKHYLGGLAMMLAFLIGFFKSIDPHTAHAILDKVGLGFLMPVKKRCPVKKKPPKTQCPPEPKKC